jgi:hypothetical protein
VLSSCLSITVAALLGGAVQVIRKTQDLPAAISVEAAGRLVGVSRSAAYRAAARGDIPTFRLGRRLYVPTVRLLEMLGLSSEDGLSTTAAEQPR